jgi:selenocysteine lyase/cysteine desulfurase
VDPTETAAAQFPVTAQHIYLNHAAVAPWPRCAAEAVTAFARENADHGAAGYLRWLDTERKLRASAARLINAPSPEDIALLKSTSEGLSVIAHGLRWERGDNVVGIHQEFPSNRVVWESLREYGVAFRALDLATSADPEQDLMALCDSRTRLLSVSAVQFSSGLRLDLERLGEACRRRDILFCIDAIQQVGALPFDAVAAGADFVVADGHKWMLGPEGIALFYSRAESRDRLRLRQFGWHMRRDPGDYEAGSTWDISPSATRFECGSPNMLGIHALEASLALLEGVGMTAVAAAVLERTRRITAWAESHPDFELLSPRAPERHSGITTLRHRTVPAELLHRRLTESGVICAVRGGGIRFSPHFYTPLEQVDRACELLDQASRSA